VFLFHEIIAPYHKFIAFRQKMKKVFLTIRRLSLAGPDPRRLSIGNYKRLLEKRLLRAGAYNFQSISAVEEKAVWPRETKEGCVILYMCVV